MRGYFLFTTALSKVILYGKRRNKNDDYKNVEIPWPKKTWSKFVGGP